MKQDTGKRSLEGFRVFPYVAWGLTLGFAVFVYNITSELQAVTEDLQAQTNALEEKIKNNDPEADFDGYRNNKSQTIDTATE